MDFLQKDEMKLIIEALLFSASEDMCAEWSTENIKQMIDIAVKIKRHAGFNLSTEYERLSTTQNLSDSFKMDVIRSFFNIKEIK